MNPVNYFWLIIEIIKYEAQLFKIITLPLISFLRTTDNKSTHIEQEDNKYIDIDKRNEWIENGISSGYLNCTGYYEFQNVKIIGSGASSNVYKANWKNSNTVVALKSFEKNNSFIINEVNIRGFFICIYTLYTCIFIYMHI